MVRPKSGRSRRRCSRGKAICDVWTSRLCCEICNRQPFNFSVPKRFSNSLVAAAERQRRWCCWRYWERCWPVSRHSLTGPVTIRLAVEAHHECPSTSRCCGSFAHHRWSDATRDRLLAGKSCLAGRLVGVGVDDWGDRFVAVVDGSVVSSRCRRTVAAGPLDADFLAADDAGRSGVLLLWALAKSPTIGDPGKRSGGVGRHQSEHVAASGKRRRFAFKKRDRRGNLGLLGRARSLVAATAGDGV